MLRANRCFIEHHAVKSAHRQGVGELWAVESRGGAPQIVQKGCRRLFRLPPVHRPLEHLTWAISGSKVSGQFSEALSQAVQSSHGASACKHLLHAPGHLLRLEGAAVQAPPALWGATCPTHGSYLWGCCCIGRGWPEIGSHGETLHTIRVDTPIKMLGRCG